MWGEERGGGEEQWWSERGQDEEKEGESESEKKGEGGKSSGVMGEAEEGEYWSGMSMRVQARVVEACV